MGLINVNQRVRGPQRHLTDILISHYSQILTTTGHRLGLYDAHKRWKRVSYLPEHAHTISIQVCELQKCDLLVCVGFIPVKGCMIESLQYKSISETFINMNKPGLQAVSCIYTL